MIKKKIFVISITALLFMGVIFSVSGYHEYINRWEGDEHGGCAHDGPAAIPSVTGTLVLTVNETGDLAPYQLFTLEIDVFNFTEAIPDPYYRRFQTGIPGLIGDNDKFSVSPGGKLFDRRERVDAVYGSYDTDKVFELMAPGEAGTYELWGLALTGFNHTSTNFFANVTNDMEMNITYVQDSVTITVVAPAAPPGIPGYMLPVMVVTVAIVGAVLIIKRKRQL